MAKIVALLMSAIFSADKSIIRALSVDLRMVMISSILATHFTSNPSSGPRGTSVGILRIVLVTGATVTDALVS